MDALKGGEQLRNARLPSIVARVLQNGLPVPRLRQRAIERDRQRGLIVIRHEQPHLLTVHHFGIAADTCRDDRQAAGGGLEKNVCPAFEARCEHEHVAGGIHVA